MTSRKGLKATRSVCPVAATLDVIGDRWSLLLIRDLFSGKSRYRDLVDSPERIATNVLASRLQRLEALGILTARRSIARRGSKEYSLTDRGRSLLPVLEAVRDWGLANVSGTQARVRIAR